jgi:hypothetical protein
MFPSRMKNISYSPKIGDETEIEDVTGYGTGN